MDCIDRRVGVALVHHLCPICGAKMEEQIVINSKLSTGAACKVEELNGKVVGFSKDACEECTKYKDEAIYFIAVDEKKSDFSKLEKVYRTGPIVAVHANLPFCKQLLEKNLIVSTHNGVRFGLIEDSMGREIGLWK